MPFLPPYQQRQSTEGKACAHAKWTETSKLLDQQGGNGYENWSPHWNGSVTRALTFSMIVTTHVRPVTQECGSLHECLFQKSSWKLNSAKWSKCQPTVTKLKALIATEIISNSSKTGKKISAFIVVLLLRLSTKYNKQYHQTLTLVM